LEIIYLDEIDSTQKFLIKKIKEKKLLPPVAVVADIQKNGIGSRGNSWIGELGNLFLSFALTLDELPKDLPIQSSSIYFSYILKDILSKQGSKIWLKWPNDFYIEGKKVGGTITSKIDNVLICGIGLNIVKSPENFGKLDINIARDELIKDYIKELKQKISWKEIFSKYKLEFHMSKECYFNFEGKKVSLKESDLCFDGSIKINNKRIYSLR